MVSTIFDRSEYSAEDISSECLIAEVGLDLSKIISNLRVDSFLETLLGHGLVLLLKFHF